MIVHKDRYEVFSLKKPVATIGIFDGVHSGHREILKNVIHSAKEMNGESAIITFEPHPRKILKKENNISYITTFNEKVELLDNIGIDHLIVIPFDKSFANISADNFIKTYLVEKFGIKKIIIGYNHRFGKDGTGDFNLLLNKGKEFGFEVEEIPEKSIKKMSVSSTKIRKALKKGDIREVNELLGYCFMITGTVVKGNQIGNTIGFPTANIETFETGKILPATGVYAVNVKVENEVFSGMLNIGIRPTLNLRKETIEVNIFDFDRDIYDKKIRVYFKEWIRDEIKFPNIEDLKEQLANDKIKSLEILNKFEKYD